MDVVVYKKPLAKYLQNHSLVIPERGEAIIKSKPLIIFGEQRHPEYPVYNLLIVINGVDFIPLVKEELSRQDMVYLHSTVKLYLYEYIVVNILPTFMYTNEHELNVKVDVKMVRISEGC